MKQNGQGSAPSEKGSAKKKNRKRGHKPLEVNEEDVARQVKETLARLTSKGQNKKGAKYRKEKREAVQEHLKEQRAEAKAESKILKLTEFVTVSEPGKHDERFREPGYRDLHERWHHGVDKPTP